MTRTTFRPGEDAQIIAEIANKRFGGFAAMFEHHGWPERGSAMIQKVQTRIAEAYGSVRAFEEHFREGHGALTMRFTSLYLSNFRGTRELEIAFEPDVTVIVGRNGAGKTSILDALAMIVGLARSQSKDSGQRTIEFRTSAQVVAEGADVARVDMEFELGDCPSGTPAATVLPFRIDRDSNLGDHVFPQDLDAWDKLVSSLPRFIYYRQERGFGSGRRAHTGESSADILDPEAVQDCSLKEDLRAIGDLGAWWDQRDAQEARRARDVDRGYRDPQLEGMRNLIARIDSFSGVAFNSTASPPGLHFLKNDGTPVHVSGLSGGERSYIILLADLARRLQVFSPGKPLDAVPAIVLIDEAELNLHPGWQSEIVPTLTDVFRACQFIVTTHSPQVLSGVDSTKVRVIEEDVPDRCWKVTVPLSTRGRTSNYLLEGVLGAQERYPPIDALIRDFNAAIDREDVSAATGALEQIEREIGDDAPTLLVLRKRLKKLRGGA